MLAPWQAPASLRGRNRRSHRTGNRLGSWSRRTDRPPRSTASPLSSAAWSPLRSGEGLGPPSRASNARVLPQTTRIAPPSAELRLSRVRDGATDHDCPLELRGSCAACAVPCQAEQRRTLPLITAQRAPSNKLRASSAPPRSGCSRSYTPGERSWSHRGGPAIRVSICSVAAWSPHDHGSRLKAPSSPSIESCESDLVHHQCSRCRYPSRRSFA
jgi:hypothetical protein